MQNIRTLVVLFFVLAALIGLFGTLYGIAIANINQDAFQTVKNNFNTFFIVTSILVSVLGVLSMYFLKADPSMYQNYTLALIHLSLFLSLLAVSFASLQQTS